MVGSVVHLANKANTESLIELLVLQTADYSAGILAGQSGQSLKDNNKK